MAVRKQSWFKQQSRIALVFGIGGVLALYNPGAFAQITPDATLGAEGSVVTPNLNVRDLPATWIEGGATRGASLFHSFSDFNVEEGLRVYFANPVGIENILTRVTGNHISHILGTLGVDGTANLFLLNPNGIIFGANARLEIGGSFFASTGSSFKFPDGSEFSATNPQLPPLLTINLTPGVQWGTSHPRGTIANAGNLTVGLGETLTLFGSTVTSTGSLLSPGGTVRVLGERVGLLDNARIDVSSETGGGIVLIGGDFQGEGSIPNAVQTFVGPQVTLNADALTDGNGGNVIVWADETTRFYGTISARGGRNSGDGGFVEVSGLNNLIFQGNADTSAAFGNTGTLLLDPTNITIVAGPTPTPVNATDGIWSAAEDPGDQTIGADAIATLLNTTSLTLEATDAITIASNVFLNSSNDLTLRATIISNQNDAALVQEGGGNIFLETASPLGQDYVLFFGGGIFNNANTFNGQGGDINITTSSLSVVSFDGSFAGLSADSFGEANAGNIFINAGTTFFSGDVIISSNVEARGAGNGGTVSIRGGSLFVTNGASIQAILRESLNGVPGAIGRTGRVDINVTGDVLVSGVRTTVDGREADSRIASDIGPGAVSTADDGGEISITARSLRVEDGATLTTITFGDFGTGVPGGEGNAGNINIMADEIAVDGSSGRYSSIVSNIQPGATGSAGDITITAARSLSVIGNAAINSNTSGYGNAGNVAVQAPFNEPVGGMLDVTLNNGGQILSSSDAEISGNGGDIFITARSLSMTNGAQLTARTVSDSAVAGNIFINTTGTGTNAGDPQILIQESTITSDSQNNSNPDYSTISLEAPNGRVFLDRATVTAQNASSQLSGDIFINAGTQIDITNQSDIKADGNFGRLFIGASDEFLPAPESIVIDNSNLTATNDIIGGSADAGEVSLRASQTIVIGNNSLISSNTVGSGAGGLLSVIAPESVSINGSQLSAETSGDGIGGSLEITTGTLNLENGARASATARTTATSEGGDVTINANQVNLLGETSGLFAETEGEADAGNLTLQPRDGETVTVNFQDGAQISAASLGSGDGGDVFVTAPDSVTLNGQGTLSARSTEAGNAGNLAIATGQLTIQNGVQATVSSQGTSPAGNLGVVARNVSLNNGSLSATTVSGFGGNIILAGSETQPLESVQLSNGSEISTSTVDGLQGGTVAIDANQLVQLSSGSRLSAEATGNGNAGNLEIATNQFIADGSQATVSSQGTGTAGNLEVQARDVVLSNQARLTATTEDGEGQGIILEGLNALQVFNSLISASTVNGQAGGVTVGATGGSVLLSGPLNDGTTGGIAIAATGRGDAGTLTINTSQLTFQDGAGVTAESESGFGGGIVLDGLETFALRNTRLSASTRNGAAGSLSINASRSVLLSGTLPDGRPAGLFVEATGDNGSAGNLNVTTEQFRVERGAQASVSSRGNGSAGGLEVRARGVVLDNGKLTAQTISGSGGNITLGGLDAQRSLESLQLSNGSEVSTSTVNGSQGGTVTVRTARSVELTGGSSLSAEATMGGNAGGLQIITNQFVLDGAQATVSSTGTGTAGNLNVQARDVVLSNQSRLAATTEAGSGGDIALNGLQTLQVNNSLITASTQSGRAGDVSVNARESVRLQGALANGSPSGIAVEATTGGDAGRLGITADQFALDGAQATVSSTGAGTAGNLEVQARDVVLSNQSRLAATTEAGSGGDIALNGLQTLQVNNSLITASTQSGRAGDVSVNARESVRLQGALANGSPGGIAVEATAARGNAGEVRLNTRQLSLYDSQISASNVSGVSEGIRLEGLDTLTANNSLISASTETGTAGSLVVVATEVVELSGAGGLSVGATSGGIAGDLSVETDRMTLRNGAQVTVSSPQGQAGNLSITSNTLSLLQGSLRAETGTSGDRGGANITLDGLDVLLLSNESLISANALEDANGGNITVDSRYIIALTPRGSQGSDIVANAVRGNGGRVNITARAGILGIEFRPIRTSENDITASSEFGFAGSVTITRPNIDPSRGLAQLPSDLVDATQLVDRSCSSAGENLADNRFIVTGRGGLPPNPAETLGEEGLLEDLGSSVGMGNEKQGIGSVAPIASSHIPSVQIIEARGWMKTADGQVMLVAEVPSATGWRSWLTYPSCQGSRLLPLE